MKSLLVVCLLGLFSLNGSAESAKPRYLVVPKSVNSPYFDEVERGCIAAAKELAVECLYVGSYEADARFQDRIIAEHLNEHIDGIAVSVINSRVLVNRSMLLAAKQSVPVVTFDSDFSAKVLAQNPALRASYIGSDNFQFGFQLGLLAKRFKPKGGIFCVLSGHRAASNMQQRLAGLYAALGPQNSENSSWEEHSRCPIYSDDDAERALSNLEKMMRLHVYAPELLDVLINLGTGAQSEVLKYSDEVGRYQNVIDKQQLVLLFGDTLPSQKKLLEAGLAHGNVGQRPYDMGYQAIYTLHALNQGKSVQPIIYTPLEVCVAGKQPLCQ